MIDSTNELFLFKTVIIVSFSHVPFIDYFFGDFDEINLVGFFQKFSCRGMPLLRFYSSNESSVSFGHLAYA